MKKIEVIYLVEDFKIGGLERVVETLYRGLDKKKFNAKVWCLVQGGELADHFIANRENIEILGLKTYHNPVNIMRLAGLIRTSCCDIIHCHGYFANTFGRIAACLAMPKALVAHVHTTYWDLSLRNILIERLLSKVTSKVICCSKAVQDFVVQNENIPVGKTQVIYNGVTCANHTSESKLGQNPTRYLMLSVVASLVENKGHRYLVSAIDILKRKGLSVHLKIVGGGPLEKAIREQVHTLQLKDRITMCGVVNNVHPIIDNCDAVVLPSIRREGLGNSIVEAMCKGKPVIASKVGGLTELVVDGQNGFLVEPQNPEALAAKIEILVNNKQVLQEMGAFGHKLYQSKFRADDMLEKIEKLYENLLSGPKEGERAAN